MKAILLASMAGILLFAVATWRLRHAPDGKKASTLTAQFLIILPVLVAAHLLSSKSLGVIPPGLQTPIPIIDLGFTLFLYVTGFFGGLLQLYNLADRGFSLRILIDILYASSGVMTLEDVMKGYSAGRGISWMYEKRVDGMVATGLAVLDADQLILTGRGRRIARIFSRLQDFTCIEKTKVQR